MTGRGESCRMKEMEQTYQMLWDCTYCGQKKLLGLSHRFCPNCGGPQNAALRYFPSDADKVAVHEHRYAGADVACPSCQHYNSRAANHCASCGGPLTGGKDAPLRPDQSAPSGMAFQGDTGPSKPVAPGMPPMPRGPAMPQGRAPGRSTPWGAIAGLLVLILIVGVIGLFCWKKTAAFEVTGLTWHRKIAIEQYGPVEKKAWCDSVPADAKIIGRAREQKSTRKVADGQDCRMERKDRGDGTFTEKQVCTPKYREEPVYADRCTYLVTEWHDVRAVEASGTHEQEPKWPSTEGLRTGNCVGCERAGDQSEDYTVHLKEAQGGKDRTCVFSDQKKWASFSIGSRWQGKQSVMTGSIDCATLAK